MTKADLEPVLLSVEKDLKIVYVKAGTSDMKKPEEYNTCEEIPNFGISLSGDINLEPMFLIVTNKNINVRKINLYDGGTNYAVDQSENHESIILKLGGIYKNEAVIRGSVGTIHNNTESLNLFDVFKKAITKDSKIIKGMYLGKEASEKFKEGHRLTADMRSPKEYDLHE